MNSLSYEQSLEKAIFCLTELRDYGRWVYIPMEYDIFINGVLYRGGEDFEDVVFQKMCDRVFRSLEIEVDDSANVLFDKLTRLDITEMEEEFLILYIQLDEASFREYLFHEVMTQKWALMKQSSSAKCHIPEEVTPSSENGKSSVYDPEKLRDELEKLLG